MTVNLQSYDEYKVAPMDWLGHVPSHWKFVRLDRLFNLRKESPKEEDQRVTGYIDGRVTLRSNVQGQKIKGVVKEAGWQRVYPGDFAISGMNAHLGGMGVSDSLGKCSPIYLVLEPKPDTNAYFISRVVRYMAQIDYIKSLVNTIRYNSADFKQADLKSIRVCLPPPDEQDAIVRFLDHADRRIRRYIKAKRRLIKLLEEQKQGIIQQAVTRGLYPGVPMRESGVEWLGKIPRHWGVLTLGMATQLIQTGPFGSQLHASEYINGGIPVINPSHMVNGTIAADPTVSITENKAQSLLKHRLEKGDIVAARRGELGRCAIVELENEGWLCGTGSLLIRVDREFFIPEYAALLISSQGVKNSLSLQSVGATMDNLNANIVSRLRLPCPPLGEQESIVELVQGTIETSSFALGSILRGIELMHEYHIRLIANVVTGKLDVREAARHLPDLLDEMDDLDDVEDLLEDEDLDEDGEDGED